MSRLAINYASRLVLAYLLSVSAAVAIVLPLGGEALLGAQAYFTPRNVIISAVLVAVGTVVVAVGGAVNIAPTLRWFVPGREPDARQSRAAARLLPRQSALLGATWVVSGAVTTLLNLDGGISIAIPTLLGVVLGGGAAATIGVLLTQQIARPILLAAAGASERLVAAPGVLARLILLWLLCSAIPFGVIVALIFVRSNGWLIPQNVSVDIAVLVVSLAAVILGLPIMILTSRSISDPIGEVVDAMSKVEKGQFDTAVDVIRAFRNRASARRIQSHGARPCRARTGARPVRPPCRYQRRPARHRRRRIDVRRRSRGRNPVHRPDGFD